MAFEKLTQSSRESLKRMVDNALNTFEQNVDESFLDSIIGKRVKGEVVKTDPNDFSKYFSPFGFSGVVAGWLRVKIFDGEQVAYKYSVVLVDGSEHAIGKNMIIEEI